MFLLVIPAQAGIHLDLASVLQRKSFHSACGRAGVFLLLVQEKVTKENTPLASRFSGSCPKSARQLACVPLTVLPCTGSGIGAIHRAAAARIAAAAAAMQRDPEEARIVRAKMHKKNLAPSPYKNLRAVDCSSNLWV